MRCEIFLKRLDELDSGRAMSPAMRLHALRCRACAAEAAALGAALGAYRSALAAESAEGSAVEDRVMAAVRLLPPPRQDFAIRDWAFAGVVIAASTLLLPLGESSGFLRTFFGPGFALSLAIVLGIFLTTYTALFIGTHLEELEDFLDKRGLHVR
jgi:hypothetical protein